MDANRVIRVDLSAIDQETAEELLSSYRSIVNRAAFRLRRIPIPGIDREDLLAVGRIAVLEAYITWNRNGGSVFSTWVCQVVRWRMGEVVQKCARLNEETLTRDPAETNTPESRFLTAEDESWFETAVSELTPRQGAIIAARLDGETLAQIAATLGIHYSRVSRELQTAVYILQKRAKIEAVDCHITPR